MSEQDLIREGRLEGISEQDTLMLLRSWRTYHVQDPESFEQLFAEEVEA